MPFWKKKTKKLSDPVDLALLEVDMHSHLVPGIDDGAPDMGASMAMIEQLETMGYRKLITSPHIMSDYYKNTSDIIKKGCDDVRTELVKHGAKIEFDCIAEYYTDRHFEDLIAKKDLLTFGDNRVLFELGFIEAPPMTERVIFEMQMAGFKPVLAHPERYNYWHRKFDKYEELHERGVLLQVNINSLTGAYGDGVKDVAVKMIDLGIVSLVGTDCHHQGHLDLMQDVVFEPSLKYLLESGNLINKTL